MPSIHFQILFFFPDAEEITEELNVLLESFSVFVAQARKAALVI